MSGFHFSMLTEHFVRTTSVFSLKPLKIKKPIAGNPHFSEINQLCLQVNGVTRLLDGVLENQNDRTVSESP